VYDARKNRVRGLWERNQTFYAQLSIPDPLTGRKSVRRVRLEDKDGNPVSSLAEALKVMARLKVKREDQTLKLDPKRTPTFSEYADTYIDRLEKLGDAKRPATVRLERVCCGIVKRSIGDLRLRQITPAVINDYMAARKAADVSARTVNVELIALRNVLRSAIQDGHLSTLPPVKRLKETKPMRRLVTFAEIERVADAALDVAPTTGQMVSDFIRLMAYSGGRWGETLRLRWQDVDFERKQIHFGADGLSKNGEARAVDFNPKLEKHLKAMQRRRAPDSDFLFPSRQRSEDQDLHSITFNKTIRDARVAAGVPDFTCHMCRHFFASMALMSKVDVHTVASWLGHKDNGVLLAKTYSHLLGEHKREQAKRVNFGPVVIRAVAQ
jgi:integrase